MSVPFVGVWLEAPEAMLIARTEQRRDDASDADADVIRIQHRQGTGVMTWHRVEAASSSEIVLQDAAQDPDRSLYVATAYEYHEAPDGPSGHSVVRGHG